MSVVKRWRSNPWVSGCALILVLANACAVGEDPTDDGDGGRNSGVGGGTGNERGGSSNGGMTSFGGMSSLGGMTSRGGTSSAGGSVTSGGAKASGGTSADGGSKASGGKTSGMGGAKASGGTSSAGGSKASGGKSGSGGAKASGGASPDGGTTAALGGRSSGGATSKGGAPPVGGADGGDECNFKSASCSSKSCESACSGKNDGGYCLNSCTAIIECVSDLPAGCGTSSDPMCVQRGPAGAEKACTVVWDNNSGGGTVGSPGAAAKALFACACDVTVP